MNTKSVLLGICIILLISSSAVAFSENVDAFGGERDNDIPRDATSGSLGDNIRWSYDSETRELVVSGYGEMRNIAGSFFKDWLKSNSVSVLKFMGSDITISTSSFSRFKCDEIIIGEGVVKIERYAFSNTNVKKVTLPSTLKDIGDYAFKSSSIEELIANGVYSSGNDAFYGCKKLKQISFGPEIKHITSSFSDCDAIESITFSTDIESIYWKKNSVSYYPFGDLSEYKNLRSIVIHGFEVPELMLNPSVVSLELWSTNTFKIGLGDSKLDKLWLRDLPKLSELDFGSIDPSTMDLFRLDGIDNVNKISINGDNKYATVVDDVLYSKDMSSVYYYPGGLKNVEYVIPETVTKVCNITNHHLKNIVFHDNLECCGFIIGDSLLCLNIPKGIVEGIYSSHATYDSLKVVMMPTQYHYDESDNDHTIIKYYSKYIDNAYATVDSEGKVHINVENTSGNDYPFRIGVKYNEDNILQKSKESAVLPSDYTYYPKVYLSIESEEVEESNEWNSSSSSESAQTHVLIVGIISLVLILAGIFFWRPLLFLGILGVLFTGLMWFGVLIS